MATATSKVKQMLGTISMRLLVVFFFNSVCLISIFFKSLKSKDEINPCTDVSTNKRPMVQISR